MKDDWQRSQPARGRWRRLVALCAAATTFLAGCSHHSQPSASLVAKLNAICREEAAALGSRFPTPPGEVAADLDEGRITHEVAAFLAQVANLFLSAAGPIRSRVRSIQVSGSDRQVLIRYEQVTDMGYAALQAVHDANARGDLTAVAEAWRRFQGASRENSNLNREFGLNDCGTLESPAIT
jgi:hypothetical protein